MTQKNCNSLDRELFEQAKSGDSHAIEGFLAPYMPFVRSLSKRFYCPSLSAQDFCQAGYLGLMHAVNHYDPEKQVGFLTYAAPWVLGEMRKALHHAVDSTGAVQGRRDVLRKIRALSIELGRKPRIQEIAECCKMPPSEIIRILEFSDTPQSLDGQERESGHSLMDIIPGNGEINLEKMDIRMALSNLPEKEKVVIILRYYRDHTQKETAEVLQCSQAQASRIERRALDLLRQALS